MPARVYTKAFAMLRRISLAVLLAACLGALLAWWWWSAPPVDKPATLVAAMRYVPATAEGAVVLGEPSRFARWVARHPVSMALLLVADPGAGSLSGRFRPLALATARAASGPVVVWWQKHDLAVGVDLDEGSRRALSEVAATEGFAARPFRAGVAVASMPTLFGIEGNAAPPDIPGGRIAALAHVSGRWWWIRVRGSRLVAVTGTPPELPAPGGASRIVTTDAGALLAPLGTFAAQLAGPARVVIAGERGWGLALPEEALPDTIRLLLSGRTGGGGAPGTPERWSGVLGTLWSLPGSGVTLATRSDLLPALAGGPPTVEEGAVSGTDAAWALRRLAVAAAHLPFLEKRAAELRTAAAAVETLRRARWRIGPAGGRIELEW